MLYGGNSGGLVYFYYENRVHRGVTRAGLELGLMGLVIQQVDASLPEFASEPLNYGVIVPAQFIKETIDLLPDTPTKKDFIRPIQPVLPRKK